MKKLLKKLCSGVGTGCFVFVAMLFIAPIFAGGANVFFAEKTGAEWQLTALCCILISVGFYIPSLIYENEKLALWLRTLIHMTIGTIVYLLTAYFCWMDGIRPCGDSTAAPDCLGCCRYHLALHFSIHQRAGKEDESKNQGEAAGRITAITKHYSSRAQSTKIGCAFSLPAPYSEERRRAASEAAKKRGVHRKVTHLYGDSN